MGRSDYSDRLVLVNARPDPEARIAMVSLPVPLNSEGLGALGDLPTQVVPVGWWPPSVAGREGAVRRQLMFALSDGAIPSELPVTGGGRTGAAYAGPEMSCRIVSKKNTGVVLSEVNEAVLTFAGKTFGLRMGLVHGGEHKWWEWVRIEELWSGPVCRAVRLGGYIEVEHFGEDYHLSLKGGLQSKALHYHNWLWGEVFALMFSNGVVHLTCRHVNNHLVDAGRDLADTVPVIGFSCPEAPPIQERLDGTRTRFDLGGIVLNLDEAAWFVGPEHPGSLRTEGEMIIYHPYEGVEIVGDGSHRERDDGYIVKASERKVPRGVARTVRFALGMGETAPVISRLVVPDWWYAHSGDLWPDRALPVHDEWDGVIQKMERGVREAAAKRSRCFDNGILTTPCWEGEIPYSQMLHFYLSGELDYLDFALHDSYHFADIAFDHATETIRMIGYPFGAIAPPLYRTLCMTFAYLETGDPYLLECSESAATHFYWIDRHNWPRRSYGRDAASVRSLIFLWDYTGKEDYLTMAREALGRAIQCQRPDGSYADQGGGVGGHGGCTNEITKPWMAMLASDPMVDYLLRRPDDGELWQAVLKTGQFMLQAQLEKDGVYYWAYQYAYGDNPGDPWDMMSNPDSFTRFPAGRGDGGVPVRFLTYLTERTGEARYLEAWQRFHETKWATEQQQPAGVRYTSNKIIQHLPYAQAHKWSARLEDGCIRIRPLPTGRMPSIEGEVSTPFGPLRVKCSRNGEAFTLETQCEADFQVLVELPGGTEPQRMSSNERRDC